MTKQELQNRIDMLKITEQNCEKEISYYKECVNNYQEVLDEATLELSELELQLAKIEEDDIDYDDNSTDQEANDSITHSASEPR